MCLCVCAGMCVYLWLWPLLPRCDPLLHFAKQPQQEVVTSDLAFTGGVKVLQTGGTGSEETARQKVPKSALLLEAQLQQD